MGPMRVNWTFPYTGQELLERCDDLIEELVERMNQSLTAEQDFEIELADYRDRLRRAGVKDWEYAKLDPGGTGYTRGNAEGRFRENQQKIAKRLQEVQEFRRQFEHDLKRDKDRLFKLTVDDIRFFGF